MLLNLTVLRKQFAAARINANIKKNVLGDYYSINKICEMNLKILDKTQRAHIRIDSVLELQLIPCRMSILIPEGRQVKG